MSADFRFPTAEQRAAFRAQPALELPPPAGNPAQLAMPAADFILELPPLDTLRSPDPGTSSDPAGDPAPAASPSGNAMEAPAAGAFSLSDLPLATFDRPGMRPAGNSGCEGESPPPAPDTVGVSSCPAAGLSAVPVAAMEAVMIERMKHFDNGHDLDSDVAAIADNPRKLSRRAERFIVLSIEDLQFKRPGYQARAKHHIAQAAAMLLAFYDAVDALEEPEHAL